MRPSSALETVLKRDRLVVLAGLAVISALAWGHMLHMARGMAGMDLTGVARPRTEAWGPLDLLLMFVMWSVMMVAMMVPTAGPMILTFATVNRRRRERDDPYVPTAIFVAGYVLVWTGFSVLATLAQWGLASAALLSPMMVSTSPLLGGLLLLLAGLFQWTPLKSACLRQCRSPMGFLLTEWRDGRAGALVMGLRHGSYCTGCCWSLMGLLFVLGVMNLLWVAAITIFVLMEKAVPRGDLVGRISAAALVSAGLLLLGQSLAR
jgi:predicted metal-binding membrane protein